MAEILLYQRLSLLKYENNMVNTEEINMVNRELLKVINAYMEISHPFSLKAMTEI
jgi:hypothetical protein